MLILASQSPRRRELLERAGMSFTVRVPDIPEVPRAGESPLEYVLRLAREKAQAGPAQPGEVVLAADTIVVADGQILEKPASAPDAARMLAVLAGRWHEVLTGVCVKSESRSLSAAESTRVSFLPLTPADIDSYVATGEPMGKAGAYAIQGQASRFIDRIEGCYFNVVGLPVSRVWRLLREIEAPGA